MVAVQMIMASASSFLLTRITSLSGAICWALCFSAMSGLQDIVILSFFAELFGAKHLGAIFAVVTADMTCATALGPAATAYFVESGHSQQWFLFLSAFSSVLAVLCCVTADPKKQTSLVQMPSSTSQRM